MSVRRRRLARCLAFSAVVVPLLGTSVAPAATPRKGVTYAGSIVERAPTPDIRVPVSFRVARDGRSVGSFSMPDGIAASYRCRQGPLGNPVGTASTSISRRGAFAITLDLAFEQGGKVERSLGDVRISGRFGAHGRFSGRFTSRSSAKVCRETFHFTARAR